MICSSDKILVQKNMKPGWWCLNVSDDISNYYNWMFRNGNINGWRLPKNGCHITFIAGDKERRIINIDDMTPYLGREIVYKWNPQIMTDGRSFWIDCECPELETIRKDLGLVVPRPFTYHITLGNFK